jgi:hypothetical protein
MIDRLSMIDRIERAQDASPYCPCGRHTTVVWHDEAVWLECSSLDEPHQDVIRRLLAPLIAVTHTHQRIVESPALAA